MRIILQIFVSYSKTIYVFGIISDPSGILPRKKKYNWLTSELLTWRQLDGQITQGILYKPENFDSTKKYPVIFRYYERLSDNMNKFMRPEFDGADIDIPTYVSNGYLVVCADIHFKFGNPGQSAYNSIVAGTEYLSKKSWVDSKRLGLDGHSYGGYMTDYIITHSHLFAAAISVSGWTDFISASNRIKTNGEYHQDYYEEGKQRMGGNLWDKPGNYIQASPIFQAQHLTTPVLLMNNKGDWDVDFAEGIQFFTALRRLGKKCWMLQYDGEGHWLSDKKAINDFMIRERQFFDHYLKGFPAPKWMVEGIPAKMKGIDDGLELEPAGVVPGPGLLTPEEQKKVDALEKRKPIHITL
jgi:dipeptidyl aminopeptidase/acylaminoacyl peptidase